MSNLPAFDGQHWLVEFHRAEHLADDGIIGDALRRSVAAAGASLLKLELHRFGPGMGIAGMALLAESHISIHTWPEHAYAAIDVFMCGAAVHPQRALEVLQAALRPGSVQVQRFARGFSCGVAPSRPPA